MIEKLTLRGTTAMVLWGHRTIAAVVAWSIAKAADGQWTVRATVTRADAFQLRQRPLLFVAPRTGGYWVWPIDGAVTVQAATLTARLGPPEQ